MIGRLNSTVLNINLHAQQVASGSIELKTLVKEKTCISSAPAGFQFRDPG